MTLVRLCVFILLQTRKAASWLAQKMKEDRHAVALLSGGMTGEQRVAVLKRFRDGKEKLLITNVPLWGIDVAQVNSAHGFVYRLRYVTVLE